MKGTSIFQFKSWPKIHQPLPRTPRESKQLLDALTSSFRRQLDNAYPATNAPRRDADRPPLNASSSVHATDQHLQNILENPLFRIVPPKTYPLDRLARENNKQKRLAEDPMRVFDERVASGTVTLPVIFNCLMFQFRLVSSSSESDTVKAMKSSRAGSKVVEWFWASDGASRQELLGSTSALPTLAKFMVSEGLQDTIIDWLRLILSRDLGGRDGQITEAAAQKYFRQLLLNLVDAEMTYGGGFPSALKYYLRVCQIHATSPHHQSRASAVSMLMPAGAHLNGASMNTKISSEHVTAYSYDEYKEIVANLTSTRSLVFASVAFYHPHTPDVQPLLHFVEKLTPAKVADYSKPRQEILLRITCDVLRVLIDQDKIREATILARHMQQLLPEQATPAPTEDRRPPVPQNTDQDLLDRLEISLA
ncbi:hypothetical protein N7468_004820 [Penicillium chermesinum]|uniref:Uncharacterized protein n=1 Tax=Penicillium chermesinum TaxID=63820 RepID=A0A9W9TSY0_9EURO|nr:uncharacterized protein N7468_004820 [Penicillium chermesinum]KAJ5240201.1 hypothetical protein N7468_004820 [Penicillium chermesinum]